MALPEAEAEEGEKEEVTMVELATTLVWAFAIAAVYAAWRA